MLLDERNGCQCAAKGWFCLTWCCSLGSLCFHSIWVHRLALYCSIEVLLILVHLVHLVHPCKDKSVVLILVTFCAAWVVSQQEVNLCKIQITGQGRVSVTGASK
jgi:hypothetical protein